MRTCRACVNVLRYVRDININKSALLCADSKCLLLCKPHICEYQTAQIYAILLLRRSIVEYQTLKKLDGSPFETDENLYKFYVALTISCLFETKCARNEKLLSNLTLSKL